MFNLFNAFDIFFFFNSKCTIIQLNKDDKDDEIDKVIKLSKEKDNMIIMADWNAVAGKMQEQGISDAFGLGKRN